MKNIQSILAFIFMTATSLMAIVLTSFVLVAWTPATAQAQINPINPNSTYQ